MEETEDLLTILERKLIVSAVDIGQLNIIDFHRCNGVWQNNPMLTMQGISNEGNAIYDTIGWKRQLARTVTYHLGGDVWAKTMNDLFFYDQAPFVRANSVKTAMNGGTGNKKSGARVL